MNLSDMPMYFPVEPGFPVPTRQNTLRLIIQRTYFDQILAGEKSEEYRDIKPSKAISYLCLNPDPSTGQVPLHPLFPATASPSIDYLGAIFPYLPRMYDYLRLVNGYASDAPVLVVKLKAIEIAQSGADEAPWIMIYHIDKVVRHNGEDLISEETFSIDPLAILPFKMIDNKREKVVDEMKLFLTKGSKLSVISGFFSIYAYAALRKELSALEDFRLIFAEPTYAEKEKEANAKLAKMG